MSDGFRALLITYFSLGGIAVIMGAIALIEEFVIGKEVSDLFLYATLGVFKITTALTVIVFFANYLESSSLFG